MEGIKNLNLNVNVTVFAPDDGNRENLSSKIFRGRIFNEEASQSLVIRIETGDGAELLAIGKPIFLFLAHDLGFYIYSAIINSKAVEDGNVVVYCSQPRQIRDCQRRKSVRVNVDIPVKYSPESDCSNEWVGLIRDISMDGLLVETPTAVTIEANIDLNFFLESIGPVYVTGAAVRSFEKDGRFFIGIKLATADKQSKDDIARFVMAEQMRQKRLGMQIFKAFIFNATIKVDTYTELSIIQYKNLDITALKGKRSAGIIREIGIHSLSIGTQLNLPVGAIVEFPVELPQLGYHVIQAIVRQVSLDKDNLYLVEAEFASEYKKIRDCILAKMSGNFDLPQVVNNN